MEVRAKKALGQHFLTDLSIAQRIADALDTETALYGDSRQVEDNPGKAEPADENKKTIDVLEVGSRYGSADTIPAQKTGTGPENG